MEPTEIHSAHCTHHPILPQNQAVYLINALIDRANYFEFDHTNYQSRAWDGIAEKFNAEFEGKRLPGSAERQTKKTVEMLYCALVENAQEYRRLICEAERKFWAAKEAAEGRA